MQSQTVLKRMYENHVCTAYSILLRFLYKQLELHSFCPLYAATTVFLSHSYSQLELILFRPRERLPLNFLEDA